MFRKQGKKKSTSVALASYSVPIDFHHALFPSGLHYLLQPFPNFTFPLKLLGRPTLGSPVYPAPCIISHLEISSISSKLGSSPASHACFAKENELRGVRIIGLRLLETKKMAEAFRRKVEGVWVTCNRDIQRSWNSAGGLKLTRFTNI